MTKFLYTLVFTLCVLCMNAQTLWTGAVSNDWNDASNWTAGIPTSGQTVTLPAMEGGNSPVYGGSPVIDFTIQNAGTLTFNSIVFNNGTIINFGGGIIINENYFINAGAMVFDNDGIFNNNGAFDNFGTYEHAGSAELNNLGTFNSLGDLNSNGPINNQGTLSITGKFITTQKLENSGTLNVTGFVDFPFGSELVNTTSGVIEIAANAKLQINSAFTNSGSLINNGSFGIQSACVLTNNGTLRNNTSMELSGKIMNENNLVNNQGIMIKSGGQLENKSNVNNQGEITMEICAVLVQESSTNIGGSIQTDGLTYEISGTANETNLEFGETFTDINQTPLPQPACKSDVFFQLDESGIVEFTAADIDRGRSYGSCGAQIVEYSISPTSFTAADAGVRIVELTITDNFGRTNSCEDFVTIIPYVEPITATDSPAINANCSSDVTASTLPGASFTEVTFTAPVATSTCSQTPNTIIDCSATSNEIAGLVFMGERNGSKYYCSNTNSLTWHQARDLAINFGGHLATVNDAEENEFIRSNIMADFAWIGYTDEAQEGNFSWLSGNSSYTNWNSGEPNNLNGIEHYTRILKSTGGWTDRNEHFQAEAVIEIPCPVVVEATIDCSNTPNEITGLVYLGERNDSKYYCSSTNSLTWHQARDLAVHMGGHLATVNDAGENEFIRSNIMADYVWIGYNDEAQEGSFTWTEGNSSYVNWRSGEPNNGNGTEHFARLLKDGGEWTDRDEHFQAEAVIEIPCSVVVANSCAAAPAVDGMVHLGTFNNSHYYKKTDGILEYHLAKDYVEARGGYLPVINSQAENTFLRNAAGEDRYWLALTDIENEGTFVWTTGAPVTYTNWSINEPDNRDGEDYTHVFSDGTWNDLPEWSPNMVVMELPCQQAVGENGEVTITQIQGIQSGGNFPVGSTQIAYRISDDCGNEEICLFDVVVEATPSVLTLTNCPEDIIINAPICEEGTTVTWDMPAATTTCNISDIIIDRVDTNPSSGDFFPVGTTMISYIVSDSCGNAEFCNFNIVVNEVEGELSVNCIDDITVTAARNETTAVANFAAPTGTTTGSGVTVRQLDGPESGDALAIGTYSVIFLISDDCNNTELCIFNVTVESTVIDDDNDGVTVDEDCDDNDPSIPTAPGSTCDDGDAATENDVIAADGCSCGGDLIVDADGDGVRFEEDCDDNDPSIPTAPGSTCDDGDATTENDVIAADGCSCGGDLIVDADGDGVRAEEDCDDNDPSIPAAPGTVCDDNSDITENDVIGADGCSCAGTLIPTCTVAGGQIALLDGSTETTICADDEIANPLAVNAFGPIGTNQQWVITDADLNILGLPTAPPFDLEGAGAGTCLIWSLSFEDGLTGATVGANAGDLDGCFELSNSISVIRLTGADCPNFIVDADGDGIAADEDCDDNDPSVPATPGTACDDANADTENDVVTADGCGCEGTPIVTTSPDCADISITAGNGSFTVAGLDGAPVTSVQCFNSQWQEEYKCFGDCEPTITETVTPGSYRIYVKYYTAAYQLICTVEEVIEVTTGQPVDADNDGVIASEDCDDNDPSVPTTPGTVCDDGNADTENDVILANGCDCAGTDVSGPTDNDNDGVPANEDCDDNDPSVPATAGTACDDGNKDTENDVVTADGCGCAGTPIVTTGLDCADISITAGNGSFTVAGLDGAPVTSVQCFNSQWQEEYKCFGDCEPTVTETVTPGSYQIYVKYYTAAYQLICTVEEVIEVTTGQPVDADNDGVIASEDCDDNDPSVPTTPGNVCNDGNADTENDVILANGCDCAGTDVSGPTDNDNDGVPANEDCDDNDPSVPATAGTTCDDGDNDTENDVVTADGCGCAGTPIVTTGPDCADISITAGNGSFTVAGLDGAPITSVQCFNATWQEEYKCFGDCEPTITETVTPGSYRIYVKYYTAAYQLICTVEEVIEVTGTQQPVDEDNDGVPADEDCDDNNPAIPATPGTDCDDNNASTTNDVILADGCDCAGSEVIVIDNDNDGVPSDQDCNDNDPSVPTTPGTVCNDNNPATENDIILSDGCSCGGTLVIDNDNDGVPAAEDCDDNNPAIPTTPGTACNDNDPNTLNDVILADGCGCAGEEVVVSNCNEDCYVFRGNIDSKVIGNSMSRSEDRGDCSKKSSSSRALQLESGATVVSAFLQWSGSGTYVDTKVRLNGTDVHADRTFTDSYSPYYFYGAYADVTDLVKAQGSSNYTVSNLSWSNAYAYCNGNAAYGAWSLVVVYAHDDFQQTAIHVCQDEFEFTFPQGTYQASIDCVDASVSCASNAELTIVTFEGDGYKGEHLRIGGQYYGDNNFYGQTAPNLDIVSFDVSQLVDANTSSLDYSIESYRVYTEFGWAVEGLIDFVKVLKYDVCDEASTFAIAPDASYLHLNATKIGNSTGLDWISNNDYRTALNIIERSENGSDWTEIEETASLTQSTNATFYQTRDEQPALGVNQYRIKQIMNDGTIIYSNVTKVSFEVDPLLIAVYPNPTVEEVNISLSKYAGRSGTLKIANALGQQMYEVSFDEIPVAPVHIELDQAYEAGTYTIMVTIEGRKPVAKLFIVSRL